MSASRQSTRLLSRLRILQDGCHSLAANDERHAVDGHQVIADADDSGGVMRPGERGGDPGPQRLDIKAAPAIEKPHKRAI